VIRLRRTAFVIGILATLAAEAPLEAQPGVPGALPAPPSAPATSPSPLAGTLDADTWRAYRARFVTEAGRVVDTANGQISHSEGQGYGMLMAAAAGDRAGFEAIWGWTRANLMVRGDELLAWRWEPDKRPAVADMNNATDGEILVAWALVEGAEIWKDQSYRVAARRMATEIGRRAVIFKGTRDPIILPGVAGFSASDRPDGPVVNLSYWVFPALQRLPVVAPEFDWARLGQTGLDLALKARFGPAQLPTEWISVRDGRVRPADGFPAVFSYNSIRIPLYLIWAGQTRADLLEPFVALWGRRERIGLPVVDTADGRVKEWMDESGYASLATILACATSGAEPSANFFQVRTSENYYPTTLHVLARMVAKSRYPRCAPG
jgi:endoglucanase